MSVCVCLIFSPSAERGGQVPRQRLGGIESGVGLVLWDVIALLGMVIVRFRRRHAPRCVERRFGMFSSAGVGNSFGLQIR